MVSHLAHRICEGVVRGGDRPALAGRDDLARVEAEAAGDAEPAARAAAVARAERAGGVFEERHVGQLVQRQRPAEEVHAEQQLRARAYLDLGRVNVHRLLVDVDEHRRQAGERDDVRGRRERVGRHEHLVTRLEERTVDVHVGRLRKALNLAEARDLGLELENLRAHGEHAARQDLGHLGELPRADVGPA